MKAIIRGTRYDTSNAILVGTANTDGLKRSDFQYWEAELHQKPRSGQFFLAGRGHGMTAFGRKLPDGSRGWGERIIPLSLEEARAWAKLHLAHQAAAKPKE